MYIYISHIKTSVSWCLTWFANRWTIEATQELDPDIQVASMGGEMMEKSCGRLLWRSNISHDPFSLSSTSNFQICWPSCSYVKNRKGKIFQNALAWQCVGWCVSPVLKSMQICIEGNVWDQTFRLGLDTFCCLPLCVRAFVRMWPWWNSWFHICTFCTWACEEEPKEKQGEGQEGLKKEEEKKEEAKEEAKEVVKKELADVKEEENEEDQGLPVSCTSVCYRKCCIDCAQRSRVTKNFSTS